MEWDEAQKFSDDLLPKLAAIGLAGVQFPEEYGGAALSAVDYCICIEELARVCPAVALSVAAHNGLCSAHISTFGSDEQKQQVSAAARPRRGVGRVGSHRGRRRKRRRRHAHDGRAPGRSAG